MPMRAWFFNKAVVALIVVSACGSESSLAPKTEPLDDEDVGIADTQIVGGEDATIAQHPFQVALMEPSLRQYCAGSILSDTWVLTAQHCVRTRTIADVRIAAGSSKRSTLKSAGQVRTVSEIVRFPDFSDPDTGKDVALLRLTIPLDLSGPNAKAIGMVSEEEAATVTAPGVVSRITGWGTLSSGGEQPDTLQVAEVNLIDQDTLRAQYGPKVTDDQLGAAAAGKDTCQGDSGGPMTVGSGVDRKLAGVTSYGQGCAEPNFAGVYARVSSFQRWIAENMKNIPPEPEVLLSARDLKVSKRKWKRYTVTIPEGIPSLEIVTYGGDGDADLFVRQGSAPTTDEYDCRSESESNMEICTFVQPPAGTWHIGVFGFAASARVQLRATVP